MADHSITVTVAGRTIRVVPATVRQEVILRPKLIQEAEQWARDNGVPEEAMYLFAITCASLMACSEGDVPSIEEYANLPVDDVEAWLDAAENVNPKWFAWRAEMRRLAEQLSQASQTMESMLEDIQKKIA